MVICCSLDASAPSSLKRLFPPEASHRGSRRIIHPLLDQQVDSLRFASFSPCRSALPMMLARSSDGIIK